jgi:para-aminobenzoate synthetase component 1
MRTLVETVETAHTPESLGSLLQGEPGRVVLRTGMFDVPSARYSIVTARPFLTFESMGSRCETRFADGRREVQFGNPWAILGALSERCEILDEIDLPFPLGGLFGFWGYDLKGFVEPRLSRHAVHDLEIPDCRVGFHGSLVVFDHRLGTATVIATGLGPHGDRSERVAREAVAWWRERLEAAVPDEPEPAPAPPPGGITSSMTRAEFLRAVEAAQRWIRSGDIYQVNLSQRLCTPWTAGGWALFRRLLEASPAPFSAFLEGGEGFSLASSSPELFLRLSGSHVLTRPIKGTRPRSADPVRDAQWMYELQRSGKEMAELVMITDLLRNDLGRVCEYGTVQVPELVRLERFAQVQHLVSSIEGRIRPSLTHLEVLRSCFPGGSITGAPKIRAMEIIDALEPVARGPYTGCLGYLGFNRESQLSITIRSALTLDDRAWFHVGAGIVADSVPEAEYDETLAKAGGLLRALKGAEMATVGFPGERIGP